MHLEIESELKAVTHSQTRKSSGVLKPSQRLYKQTFQCRQIQNNGGPCPVTKGGEDKNNGRKKIDLPF